MPSRQVPWLEPVEAYARLRGDGAILLDSLGAHPEAHHSIIALGHAWEARIQDGLVFQHADGRREEHDLHGLDALQAIIDRLPERPVEGPFTGGLVGTIGYEFLGAIEATLPCHVASTPDVLLRLCRDAIVFDRRHRTVTVYCNDLDGEDGAADRLDAWVERMAGPRPALAAGTVGDAWQTSLDEAAFTAAVERLRSLIHEGDLFQANLATRFSIPCSTDPVLLYERLAKSNPSPYMGILEADDHAIVSCSPEQLMAVADGRVRTRPIAGTRPRGEDADTDAANEADLLGDAKEQAEHTMLVDLLRNDVAKISVPGSVHVPERMSVERYRHVMHLVSRVEGRLRPDATSVQQIAAIFPGGTITGAPKHRACLRIHEAEPVARGPYTGSMGYIGWDRSMHWNIMIRTMLLQDGIAHIHAGSGIVADSDPTREWQEAGHKARALLDAAQGLRGGGVMDRLGEVTAHGRWAPEPPGHVDGARVLLIDNYDSFTYNLADQCAALGAAVDVVRNDADWRAAVAALDPTHIIISPGPGRPEDSGASLEVLAETDVPVLGVCLGHQAMGLVTGARIDTVPPVHGKQATLDHAGTGLITGQPQGLRVGRYHSLVVAEDGLPEEWHIDARAAGLIMAMHHTQRPWHGLQFHPESICSEGGLEILRRFLSA